MTVKVTIDGDFENVAIQNAIKAALESEGVDFDCEIEVIIADEQEIKDLNNETRGIDRVTDVLSFPMFESVDDAKADADGSVFLGSMVICKKRAIEQAQEYGHSVLREVSFLAVHSVLHLLGYDHELSEEDEREMFSKQSAVLENMGITR
jgi:probable rRNA maturation factor